MNVLISLACGTTINVEPGMVPMLTSLLSAPRGGFATVMGYRPSTGYTVRPLVDYTINTRFGYIALLKRERAATEALTFNDIAGDILTEAKLRVLSVEECEALFNARKAERLASLDKSIAGDTDSDAQRAAHARNYARVCEGVRIHYITAPDDSGMMVPVLASNGFPTAEHIIVEGLSVSTKYREKGERKVVNSRAPTIMGNLIANAAGKAHKFRTFKLTAEACEGIRIGGETLDMAA